MPASRIVAFADADRYRAAIRGAAVEMAVTARGDFRAELTQIDLPRLWMQRGSESLPRVWHAEIVNDRGAIFFLADTKQVPIQLGGMELPAGELALYRSHAKIYSWTSGPISWGSMSLTPESLADAGHILAGCDLTLPPDTRKIRPHPALMSRLLRLHAIAGELARTVPEILVHPGVAKALDQALVHAMIGCLTGGSSMQPHSGRHHHSTVMERFEELLAATHDRPLYLAEICAATGASERTLRVCCREHLGMGPIRYLWLRRMHLTRRALRRADPSTTTVTEIATRFGFWELGRFSVEYKRLFGESPSLALRRPPDDRPAPEDRPLQLSA